MFLENFKSIFASKTQILCPQHILRGEANEESHGKHWRNTDFECFPNVSSFAYPSKISWRRRICVSEAKMFCFFPFAHPYNTVSNIDSLKMFLLQCFLVCTDLKSHFRSTNLIDFSQVTWSCYYQLLSLQELPIWLKINVKSITDRPISIRNQFKICFWTFKTDLLSVWLQDEIRLYMDIQSQLVNQKWFQTTKKDLFIGSLIKKCYAIWSSIGAEIEKDCCKGVKMRELNDMHRKLHGCFDRIS